MQPNFPRFIRIYKEISIKMFATDPVHAHNRGTRLAIDISEDDFYKHHSDPVYPIVVTALGFTACRCGEKGIREWLLKETKISDDRQIVALKFPILLATSNRRHLECVIWNDKRASLDPTYPSRPDVTAGYYPLKELGNGGREMAILDGSGRSFIVHQDHAELMNW
jgi:hypothetical protein